jgi:hypothetical protein
VAKGYVAGIGCNLKKPTSSSTISITSCDPKDLPTVVPNHLGTCLDRQSAREIIRAGWRLIMSPSIQSVLERPIDLTESIANSDALLNG